MKLQRDFDFSLSLFFLRAASKVLSISKHYILRYHFLSLRNICFRIKPNTLWGQGKSPWGREVHSSLACHLSYMTARIFFGELVNQKKIIHMRWRHEKLDFFWLIFPRSCLYNLALVTYCICHLGCSAIKYKTLALPHRKRMNHKLLFLATYLRLFCAWFYIFWLANTENWINKSQYKKVSSSILLLWHSYTKVRSAVSWESFHATFRFKRHLAPWTEELLNYWYLPVCDSQILDFLETSYKLI